MADEEKKVSVTFTQTKVVENEHAGTDKETRFEAGKTYELSPRSADRWVKRGVAEFASDEDAAAAAGASSDVALRIQDEDRHDPAAQRGPVTGTGTATDDGDVDGDYTSMKVEDLKAELAKRQLTAPSGSKKPDLVKMLERNDKVTAAIEAKDYDVLHADELDELAEKRGVSLAGRSNKADKIAAIEEAEKAPAA